MRRFLLAVVLLMWSQTVSAQPIHGIQAGYRFSGVPGFLISPSFSEFQPVTLHCGQLEFFRGTPERFWSFGMLWAGLAVPDGPWQVKETLPEEGVFAEFPLSFIGGMVSHTWRWELGAGFTFSPTVGLGLLGVVGDVYATETIPGCKAAPCGYWDQVTRHPVEFSSRVLPVLQASVGLGYQILKTTHVSLDAGFMDLPFVGLTVQQGIPRRGKP